MKFTKFTQFTAALFFGCALMTFQSCEEELVRGCTDPESLNYDSLAEEDDGSCTYNSERFIAVYSGPFDCQNTFLSSDTLILEITELDGASRDSVNVTLTVSGVPLNAAASVLGDVITMNAQLLNVPINIGPIMATGDVDVTGSLTLSENDTKLSGPVNIVAKNPTGSTIVDTECTYVGTKQ